jgi:protein KTI12
MPCLVLTGHPCVGKTTVAHLLAERAKVHKSKSVHDVVIINEESVCVDQTKRECYLSSHAEKSTRSSIKAQVDRSLIHPNCLVICDSLNYIKGYRYELHCLSKAAKQRHGVIWILNAPAVAQLWNEKRSVNDKTDFYYTADQIQELIQRYEPPDARNRWDNPLYRIDVTPFGTNDTNQAAEEALSQSVYNMHDLSKVITTDAGIAPSKQGVVKKKSSAFRPKKKESESAELTAAETTALNVENTLEPRKTEPLKSLEERLDDILDSFLSTDVAPLKEGISTRQNLNAESNVLHEVDSLTQQVCNLIQRSQSQGLMRVSMSDYGSPEIVLETKRKLHLTELKRVRKQFIRWVNAHSTDDPTQRGIVVSFVQYLDAQL